MDTELLPALRRFAAAFGLVLLFVAPVVTQAAEKRVALVVGVSQYQYVPRLSNPANDAREIAKRLRSCGFEVEALYEKSPGKAELDAALRRLRQRSVDADAAVVYFAGHGIEINGSTYLLPSDTRLEDERDAKRCAFH